MGSFFTKKKRSNRVTERDLAILQLKQTRDKIKQYQKRIEGDLEKNRLLAKELVKNGKKDRALLLLRKKVFQEKLLTTACNELENIERMVQEVEFKEIELTVFESLKVGNNRLKQLNSLLSIDEIEKVMDETREGIEKQKEIDEVLCGTLADISMDEMGAEMDATLEAELEALKEAEIKEKMPDIPEDVVLPDVPNDLPNQTNHAKDKIKELAAVTA